MKKKKYIIALTFCLIILFLLLRKWNVDIYMESVAERPHDKIDLKVMINDNIAFNDTLQKNPFSFPTHIVHPMRIGFHTISVSSKMGNFQQSQEIFVFFNYHIALYYGGDPTKNTAGVFIVTRAGIFAYE